MRPAALRVASVLLFKIPITRTEQLDMLSVDDLTYGMHWRVFAADLMQDWRESAYMVQSPTALTRTAGPR